MESGLSDIAVSPSTPLTGDADIESCIASVPEFYTIRGLFFSPLVAHLGDDFAKVSPKLCDPPASGRYLSLMSYSIRDHIRLIDTAACRLYPDCPNRQAHRLLGRTELENFRSTLLGRAVLSVIDDPGTLLLRYPEIFNVFTTGPEGQASRESPSAIKIELMSYFGSIEYQIGVFEGFVMNFGFTSRIEVKQKAWDSWVFLVKWH